MMTPSEYVAQHKRNREIWQSQHGKGWSYKVTEDEPRFTMEELEDRGARYEGLCDFYDHICTHCKGSFQSRHWLAHLCNGCELKMDRLGLRAR